MKTQFKKITMYNEIKNFSKECKSISAISRKSGFDRKTVRKYLSMSESDLESYLEKVKHRQQKLSCYEIFVKERIEKDSECSAAQVEDWLKEYYPDFPPVTSRTVYNFVHKIRLKYNLAKTKVEPRQFEAVEELAYGSQAQADFGEYSMVDLKGYRVKVYFMVMSLSRSRARFVYFTNQPVTTWFLIRAHEEDFAYFEEIPQEIVYDQDSTILVDENSGELIFTRSFGAYVLHAGFNVHMCHKKDPQSKGKVENCVKYVKGNFLRGRQFVSLDTLNSQALDWANRTANAKVHSTTRSIPHEEWLIDKDNTVLFRGNRYALPAGTYQGPSTQVRLRLNEETLDIMDMGGKMVDTFQLETQKGKLIRHESRKRNTSVKVLQLE